MYTKYLNVPGKLLEGECLCLFPVFPTWGRTQLNGRLKQLDNSTGCSVLLTESGWLEEKIFQECLQVLKLGAGGLCAYLFLYLVTTCHITYVIGRYCIIRLQILRYVTIMSNFIISY